MGWYLKLWVRSNGRQRVLLELWMGSVCDLKLLYEASLP